MRSMLVSMVAASLVAGCGNATGPDALIVTASVSSPLPGGDTTLVYVSLVNPSSSAIHVSGSACPFTFEILDRTGVRVGGSGPQVCIAIIKAVTLAPGASVTAAFRWVAADTGSGQPLTPGAYRLRGFCEWVAGRGSAAQSLVVVPP
jgi:hypothetical protein